MSSWASEAKTKGELNNQGSGGSRGVTRGSCALRATEDCAFCGRLDVEGPGWKELAEIYAASFPRVAKNHTG